MALAADLFYIIFSWISLTVNIALLVFLFNNFIKKKTTGTLILFSSYFVIALGATLGAVVYTLEFLSTPLVTIGVLQSLSTITPQIGLILIYIFSTRHILRDNEVAKTLTTSLFSALLGFILTMYLLAVYGLTEQFPGFILPEDESAKWFQLIRTNISGTDLYNLSISFLAPFITIVQIYLNLRIIIKSFILSRRTDKIIRKRGLQMIGWGLVTYLLGGLVISLEIGVPWPDGSHIPTIFWTLRKLIFLVSYFILYLGWIMPDWFRRRIRGKTWFEMRYKEVSKFTQ